MDLVLRFWDVAFEFRGWVKDGLRGWLWVERLVLCLRSSCLVFPTRPADHVAQQGMVQGSGLYRMSCIGVIRA